MKWFKQSQKHNAALESPVLRAMHTACTTLNPRRIVKQTLAETRFVIIDTETTGFKVYAKDEIVSIAMLELNGLTRTGREYNTLINPGRGIPQSSTEIHGISDADVTNAPSLNDQLPEILQFINDAVLVGHHINFDLRFLNMKLQQLLGCSLQNPFIDTMLLYLELSGKIGHYSLEDVAKASGIEVIARHTAGGDALTTLNIFVELAKKIIRPTDPVSKLIAMQYNTEV